MGFLHTESTVLITSKGEWYQDSNKDCPRDPSSQSNTANSSPLPGHGQKLDTSLHDICYCAATLWQNFLQIACILKMPLFEGWSHIAKENHNFSYHILNCKIILSFLKPVLYSIKIHFTTQQVTRQELNAKLLG